LSSTSGTAPSTINALVNISGLSTRTYTATITISSSGAQGSPQIIPVTLNIVPPASINTLILTNRQQLAVLYGSSQADQVMTKLNTLAAHADVNGLIIQVENNSAVATAYAARGNDYNNKSKANAVAETVKQLILAQWNAHPTLKYLVIAGDDRVLPFYRTTDGTGTPDPWTLTDDFYTDRQPTPCTTCANPYLYIPDLAGGRLVESPNQITGQIDTFLTNNTLNLSSGMERAPTATLYRPMV
jgi:hypothetical protein